MFGHPKGLVVLFFTEMWERFSFYGMKAIFVLYLVSEVHNGGQGWSNDDALELFGLYGMMVYVMGIPGGWIADKLIGQKKAVMLGGALLVAGHSVLAITAMWAFYFGLVLLVCGVGLLKPNISSLVGALYAKGDARRDAGFTIFYIGINVGAFLAAIIVGYLGEKVGWHYGFGAAGIGMAFGQLVFWKGQKYLVEAADYFENKGTEKAEDTQPMFPLNSIEWDRIKVLLISFIVVIVFWGAFEQTGGSMNIFAQDYTERHVYGDQLTTEVNQSMLNSMSTAGVPPGVVERVKNMEGKTWRGKDRFDAALADQFLDDPELLEQYRDIILEQLSIGGGSFALTEENITELTPNPFSFETGVPADLREKLLALTGKSYYGTDEFMTALSGAIGPENAQQYGPQIMSASRFGWEIPTSWFQSLNSLFIMIFGSIMAALWISLARKNKEPNTIFKLGIGTVILGLGFIFMMAASIEKDASVSQSSSMWWLVGAYLFHTIGELCLSPVSLSYITKMAPERMVSLMMGLYFAATGVGNWLAGKLGTYISGFGDFTVFTMIAGFTIAVGLLLMAASGALTRLTHGADLSNQSLENTDS